MDTDMPQVIDPGTLLSIEELGTDLDTILGEPRPIFTQYLDALRDLSPTLHRFHVDLANCTEAFHPPTPTKGCDSLEQQIRDACVIIDTPDRIRAIDEALGNIATVLGSAKDNYNALSARRKLLAAPLNVSDELIGAVSYTTQEFPNIMIKYNTWMKEHKTDINTTLDIQARAEAIATDIAAQTQFCITAIQSDINDLTQQMETVGSVYRHAASLYSLLKAWVEIWNTNGSKFKEQPSKSAWVSPTYSMYPQQWSLATTDTMGDARRPEHKQRQKIRSPFHVLPPHIRALAPHQARFWWKFGLEDRNDFLLLRETMLDNPLHATDGKFHAIDKKREVRCLIYNWDSVNFDSDDVCAYIRRLDLGFVDELLPKMGGKIPILDIRAQHMTPFLWALLERRSGFIDDFTFSICQSVGIDDGSAPNVAWANLTHLGRKYLQNTQIPDGLQDHILRVCGVPTICSTQSLDNDWAHATCSTGRFAISVQKKADWITIQTIPFAKKYINLTQITGMGSVLGNAASKGELAISATMGPFPLDIQELPSRTMEGPITRLLQKHGLEPAGFKRTGGGWKCSVRIGFPSEPMRTSAAILLSRRCHPGINGGKPLQVAVRVGCSLQGMHPMLPS